MDKEKLAKALEGVRMLLPEAVADIRGEEYEDSMGEQSVQIWVILADSLPNSQVKYLPVREIKDKVIGQLQGVGITQFPFFFFVKESEYHKERHLN